KNVFEKCKEFYKRYDVVDDARGLGAMCALEFVKDKARKEPAKQLVGEILQEARKRGVIAQNAGVYDNVIRLLMPLVITDEQLDEGLDILEEAIEAVVAPTEAVK